MNGAVPPTTRRGARLLERLLLVLGVVSLGYYGWVSLEASLYQAYEHRELNAILAAGPSPTTSRASGGAAAPPPGTVIGRIEIPRLGVSSIVRTGSDARTLQLAVGHIPGTALPGEGGNIGLAGHRDTFFRRLADIEPDDTIHLVTSAGTFEYRVERTLVVQPKDVWVLDPTDQPTLTLVTCYPFRYVGTAPERFIVRAARRPGAPMS